MMEDFDQKDFETLLAGLEAEAVAKKPSSWEFKCMGKTAQDWKIHMSGFAHLKRKANDGRGHMCRHDEYEHYKSLARAHALRIDEFRPPPPVPPS